MSNNSDEAGTRRLRPRRNQTVSKVLSKQPADKPTGSRKRKAETGPLPEASCHKQKRRRAGAQDATVRQDVQSVISIESATIEPRAKLVLSIKRITDDEPRSAAKNEKSRHSDKRKLAENEAVDELPGADDLENGLPEPHASSDALQHSDEIKSAITNNDNKAQIETIVEYVGNVLEEHTRALCELPSAEDFEDLRTAVRSLKDSLEIRDRENDRLRYENKLLLKAVEEVKSSNAIMAREQDEFRRYFGAIPPRYRRRDDLRGRPFEAWRRNPATAAHRPRNIFTDFTTRSSDRIEIVNPVSPGPFSNGYESSNGTLRTEVNHTEEDEDEAQLATDRHRPNEILTQRGRRSTPFPTRRVEDGKAEESVGLREKYLANPRILLNDPLSTTEQSLGKGKRRHEEYSSDVEVHLTPVKRSRFFSTVLQK